MISPVPLWHEAADFRAAAIPSAIGGSADGQRANIAASADLLMQDAEDDLYAEALRQLGRTADDPEIAEVTAALRAPLHPNC